MVETRNDSSLYKQLAELPSYKAAQFQSANVLRVTTTTTDHVKVAKRTSIKTYVVSEGQTIASVSPDVPEIAASALSPSRKYLAVLRESNDNSAPDGKKRFVEIWAEDKIQASLEVTDIHGAFYTDEYLFSISFSPSESKIVYTAEGRPDEPESDPLAKYRFTPNFGETYGGKKLPSVFLFDWKTSEKPTVFKITPAESSAPALLGHPVFGNENQVFAVAYEYTGDHRLLGVIYCPNRQASIWEFTVPTAAVEENLKDLKCIATKLTTGESAVRSPRVHYDAQGHAAHLIWLSNAVGGPHATCSALLIRDLSSNETSTLVKSVWDPELSQFPGLYLNTLPATPFLNTNNASTTSLVLSSIWRSRSVILQVGLSDGTVVNLTPDDEDVPYSWTILSTDEQWQILATRSAPNRPPELLLGSVANGVVSWLRVEKPNIPDDVRKKLEDLKVKVISIPGREPTETIVVRKLTQDVQPSITMPHGGPHSANALSFSPISAALAIEGYTISYPGYTGSLGFGEKHVNELLGKIGSLDIEDCIASIKHLVSLGYTAEGPGQQYLMGGSHGGFITGHLIGQYPTTFSGAILRNPVISLGELSYSDIPDWYFEESGIRYTPTSLVTPELYQKLWSMSPISHVDKVQCPVVLMIGDKDQRVPTTQGRGYYHALKGRGKDVQMLCFKDDIHAIDSVEGALAGYQAAKELFGRKQSESQAN
ncbi:Alpha/Beta hydrolase protein [Irpex rosettiformis]|uniref:Alpha/Beta hydrolase protein n=1 Tax=Irpex rosettiformis TaxID=378272 RepID=A0ACB8TZM3_9APHY|nr:Alpha/Beta hydrolase protein [Irpex rosettiformis]